jgi:hypothetical protein
VAVCADRRFELRSEVAIRTPQKRRIAVGRSFKFFFNANMTMAIDTLLQQMWFSAL